MRALIIEDDKLSSQIISKLLKDNDFTVEVAEFGEEGFNLGKYYDFDIILLDLNLPDVSGLDVLQRFRGGRIGTPVLILTGDIETSRKVLGLQLGADDYVTKPYDKHELLARVHAVIRRSRGLSNMLVKSRDLTIDLDTRSVWRGKKQVLLTHKEFQLLKLFAVRKDITITKEMIMEHLYDGESDPGIKVVDVLVYNLRKKLGPKKDPQKYIKTIWGRGYMMTEENFDTVSSVA